MSSLNVTKSTTNEIMEFIAENEQSSKIIYNGDGQVVYEVVRGECREIAIVSATGENLIIRLT